MSYVFIFVFVQRPYALHVVVSHIMLPSDLCAALLRAIQKCIKHTLGFPSMTVARTLPGTKRCRPSRTP